MSAPPLLVTVDRRGPAEFGPGWRTARQLADTMGRAKVPAVLVDINEDLGRMLRRWPSSPLFVLADTFAPDSPNRARYPRPFELRRALEQHGRPYIGTTYTAFRRSSSADKVRARAWLEAHVTLPRALVVARGDVRRAADEVAATLGFPVVVKRARQAGASIGVELAQSQSELETILREGVAIEGRTLAEEYVAGREFSVWVLELGDEPEAFGVVEVHKKSALLTQCGKVLGRPGSRPTSAAEPAFETPPRAPRAILRRVEAAAVTAHRALGLRHYSRVDLVVREGEPHIVDVNARPHLSAAALGMVARARGESLEGVLRRLVHRHLLELRG